MTRYELIELLADHAIQRGTVTTQYLNSLNAMSLDQLETELTKQEGVAMYGFVSVSSYNDVRFSSRSE